MTPDGKPPSRRKAWRYAPKAAPPLGHLWAGRTQRQAFLRYWISDNLWNAAHLATYVSLRLLPMDTVSRFGAALGRFAIPRYHKGAAARARDTMQRLRPTGDKGEEDRRFQAYCAAQGRVMTEFSAVGRIAAHPDRISIADLDIVREAAGNGPVILAGMHLGNWEILPIVMATADIPVHSSYVPPLARAQAWIASHVRRKIGLRLLPPGVQGLRPALKVLQRGGVISIFCDEAFAGKIRGPFFGRPAHLEGNMALAVRLARLTGATICPWYAVRGDGFRFTFQCLPALTLPAGPASDSVLAADAERLAADAERLNALIEPVISAHLEQWFFVDSALPKSGASKQRG